jgi:REP element-mobilizing transposase RayT
MERGYMAIVVARPTVFTIATSHLTLPPAPAGRALTDVLLKSDAMTLDSQQRQSVERALREVCEHRGWLLHAMGVRRNHVHVVVSTGGFKPERALNAFKAYATRRLRADGRWNKTHSPWADRGSKKYLWTERSMSIAIDYVINGQGGDLPEFE